MHIAIVGAGMVGVSCALALRQRGLQVTLFDRLPPGSATSYGNAGVLAPSSLIPFNHPGLWGQLPTLLRGAHPGFRYQAAYLARQARWTWRFLAHARARPFETTVSALHALIGHSREVHHRWLREAALGHRLRDQGWLVLYRSEAAWRSGAWTRAIYDRYGVAHESLDAAALRALEPGLQPVFARAVWLPGAGSVDDPAGLVRAYADLLTQQGGRFVQAQVRSLGRLADGGWTVLGEQGALCRADQVVVALGPFSKDFLERGHWMRLPMAFERGSHMHYAPGPVPLQRPVYDTAGGYVLSPMAQGWRLTTGVELNDLHAPTSERPLQQAESWARQAIAFGNRLDASVWHGSRPTLPDSRPMIGPVTRHPGLWVATGHQHIGFSTGPGTGELLADLMLGRAPAINPAPFSPSRFGA